MTQYLESSFTKNKILLTEKVVVKCCDTAYNERAWYAWACINNYNVPKIYYDNSDTIVMERIYGTKPTAEDILKVLHEFKTHRPPTEEPFSTYINNLTDYRIGDKIKHLNLIPTFFHGDLSTTNVIMSSGKPYLIDPNYKGIFGNYQTDAAKAIFSFLVFEQDLDSAKIIAKEHIKEIWLLAAAEGSRVAKYNPKYRTFVNNILDIYESL